VCVYLRLYSFLIELLLPVNGTEETPAKLARKLEGSVYIAPVDIPAQCLPYADKAEQDKDEEVEKQKQEEKEEKEEKEEGGMVVASDERLQLLQLLATRGLKEEVLKSLQSIACSSSSISSSSSRSSTAAAAAAAAAAAVTFIERCLRDNKAAVAAAATNNSGSSGSSGSSSSLVFQIPFEWYRPMPLPHDNMHLARFEQGPKKWKEDKAFFDKSVAAASSCIRVSASGTDKTAAFHNTLVAIRQHLCCRNAKPAVLKSALSLLQSFISKCRHTLSPWLLSPHLVLERALPLPAVLRGLALQYWVSGSCQPLSVGLL